ncbi:suppressor of fused domain protein [Actinoplanes sp. TRM 88003]|uniref:Suppressor of fused domain protein n=1 Tax=Paractinoplanes aksuensis TaxID=2939490 RepID=A0ABT1DF48_9ACTN|nr:suppressor of fused domain protein [Actinoplanes aksuensis]MCO8269446.1 suppressor of fused domain protein [Actinoplanes aksuensis]
MTSDPPGWDAIDERLGALYPGVEPQHFGTLIKFAMGGPDPLDGVSFYARSEPVPHWHLVGYGMSELYEKETDNADESGWGFEFTFRVARDEDETEPPLWAANLLQNLARYVYSSGNWFEPGHHMNANGPIRHEYETAVTALAFAEDPELGAIGTPNGRVLFLQVVGLTGDEYEAARRWNTNGVLALLAERQPLLVTDLDRPSATDDPEVRAAVEAGRARDGSSTGWLLVGGFTWAPAGEAVRLTVKEITAGMVADAVRDRLPYGRSLLLEGGDHRVLLNQAGTAAVRHPEDGPLEIDLPPAAVTALIGATAIGSYGLPEAPGVMVEVVGESP